jgi:acetolactate synthase-1/3 small subunit
MQSTLIARGQDGLSTLNRIVSLLRGRSFGIVSLTSGRTDTPGEAHLTIVVDASRTPPDRVASCLEKLEDVWSVEEVDPARAVQRELALVKIARTDATGPELASLLETGIARVVDSSDTTVIVEVVGAPQEVDRAISAMSRDGVVDVARVGQVAMVREARATRTSS